MIVNTKVINFVNEANANLQASGVKFIHPQYEAIQERMMRLGIEARALKITSEEELESIAIATIKNDYVRLHHGA